MNLSNAHGCILYNVYGNCSVELVTVTSIFLSSLVKNRTENTNSVSKIKVNNKFGREFYRGYISNDSIV